MEKFILNITASSGEFYQGYCESLTLPTGDGVYGVQAGHNPVLVALHMGIAKFTVDGETREVLVGDGIAEVTPTFVLLLVDSAERPEDIDRNRAEAARIRAEERLQHKQSMHEYYQSKIALDRAMQRLQTCRQIQALNAPLKQNTVSLTQRADGVFVVLLRFDLRSPAAPSCKLPRKSVS
ncbi:MAG: ATP synthase F1 subunit epsilon [Faecalibacterium sp.]